MTSTPTAARDRSSAEYFIHLAEGHKEFGDLCGKKGDFEGKRLYYLLAQGFYREAREVAKYRPQRRLRYG